MSRGRIEVTRTAWRRLRELLVSRRRQDRTGSADEPAEEAGRTPGRTEETGPSHPAPVPPGSMDRLVGCFALLTLLFISSALVVLAAMINGSWDVSWGTVAWTAVSLVIAVLATALAWRAGRAWQRRRSGAIETNPPAERTKDDQNSVGKP